MILIDPKRKVCVLFVAALLAFSFLASCKMIHRGDSSSSVLDTSGKSAYTGSSDYRLIFIHRQGPDFDPNQDILRPSAMDLQREKVFTALKTSTLTSLIPLVGTVTGNLSGTEPDFLTMMMTLVSSAQTQLHRDLGGLVRDNSGAFPVIHEALLVPSIGTSRNMFYSSEKISMDALEIPNVLGVTAQHERFAEKLTEQIKTLQKKLYAESNDPIFLLSLRHFLFVNPGSSRLTVMALIGIKPTQKDFPANERPGDDKVVFNRVVVPEKADRGIVASLLFDVNLADPGESPQLHIEFGDFSAYEKGRFVLDDSGRQRVAPRLEGELKKLGRVAINSSFIKMTFDMRRMQLTELDTLVSPGLQIGPTNWVLGGLHMESADAGFQSEINNKLDAEIKKALDSGSSQIFGGTMKKEYIEFAFARIFGRRG